MKNPTFRPVRRLLLGVVCTVLPVAFAGTSDEVAPPDWDLSKDGSLILHRSARVAWPRCVEGMQWSGQRCTGQALQLDHAEALARVKAREKAEGMAWRLPHMKELQQLAHQNTRPAPAGQTLLPAVGQGWSWTASTTINTPSFNTYSYNNIQRGLNGQNANQMKFLHGWAVNTATVQAQGDVLKRSKLLVRLVRPWTE
ncbi:MAG: DUF1566 domain-containing protein [Hydrogenophaga sp.]|uniref:Lcl domain-containing protein n=1 Tax=Hydrogenophaga sp. TaxID=1904254 RepID=UPI0027292FE6|nr:DUF1566 domain-containing protein [Hydrogenophaga sp.]MDO9032858.1 DUF1566 domain-containing protein [Hydrogenophaga sp.]